RLAGRQRTRGKARPERLPFQELDYDVRRPVVRAEVVHCSDVWVVQDSGRPRLLLEPFETIRSLRERSGQHLDRAVTAQPRALRAITLAHPPGADRRDDLIRSESRSRSECHRSSQRGEVSGPSFRKFRSAGRPATASAACPSRLPAAITIHRSQAETKVLETAYNVWRPL